MGVEWESGYEMAGAPGCELVGELVGGHDDDGHGGGEQEREPAGEHVDD